MKRDGSVYIIVLNYNGWKDTLECVSSLLQLDYPDTHIIVIDNASTDGSMDHLKQITDERVEIIESGANRGYAGGNNVGIRYAIEKGADYLCVINNDTIVDKTFIGKCVEVLKDESYGIVSPVILEFGTATVQSAGGKISVLKGRHEPHFRGTDYAEIRKTHKLIDCEFISGCCMVFRAELVKRIGCLPEAYFLFYEETEWCCKAVKQGYRNACVTDCYIEHKDSGSVNSITGIKDYLLKRNRAAFVRRNGSFVEKAGFLLYISIYTARLKMQKRNSFIHDAKCYSDGLFKKIDKQYPYIVIKE